MSLYHEAAEIVEKTQKNGGSLKSIVFGKKTWKTDAKTLFALTSEAAKWSEVLSEVVERSGILGAEKSVSTQTIGHSMFFYTDALIADANSGSTSYSRSLPFKEGRCAASYAWPEQINQ